MLLLDTGPVLMTAAAIGGSVYNRKIVTGRHIPAGEFLPFNMHGKRDCRRTKLGGGFFDALGQDRSDSLTFDDSFHQLQQCWSMAPGRR